MLEAADIFRDWGEEFKKQYAWQLDPVHYRAIDDIIKCRTPKMKYGTLFVCPGCGERHFAWLSCGNRNCPKCGREKVTRWLQKRQEEILPIDYFMATFTLPAEFHTICRQRPEYVYDIFFKTASAALKQLARNPKYLGAKTGMTGTLQTWRRDGEFHPHIHFLIPGGGVSFDGKYWLYPKSLDYLVPAKALGVLFRGKFKAELEKMDFLPGTAPIPAGVWKKNFVVDVKKVGNGMSSFKYIAPYMQRGFISNSRIKKYDGASVTFEYKDGQSGRTKYRTLSALKFMSLYMAHVLPSGFQKTRYYGLEASANKLKRKQIRLLILLSRRQPPPEKEEFAVQPILCSKCGAKMEIMKYHIRPPPSIGKSHE